MQLPIEIRRSKFSLAFSMVWPLILIVGVCFSSSLFTGCVFRATIAFVLALLAKDIKSFLNERPEETQFAFQ